MYTYTCTYSTQCYFYPNQPRRLKTHQSQKRIFAYIHNSLVTELVTRAHSFRGPRNFEPTAELVFFPRNLGRGLSRKYRGIRLFPRGTAEFDVFHSNSYFSQKMTSKYLF